MSSFLKSGLLATASAIALISTPIAPAQAFDAVNWTWDAEVIETVTKDVTVTIDMEPNGMVMVEDLQVNIGDVTATSTVTGVENNQPQGGGVVDLGTQDIQFQYDVDGELIENDFKSDSVVDAFNDESSGGGGINGTVTVSIDLGEVDVPPTQSFDAVTELPSVVSAATAVANNSSITSDTSLELHEGQFAFNVDGENGNGDLFFSDAVDTGNSNLSIALLLGANALTGGIDKANISATSTVSDILNASVDSSATAVTNNLSVSLAPASPDDSLVIADIVQFAFADVSATSSVSNVSLNSYTNLGAVSPIVNSVATAVGNNKNITVGAPVVNGPAQ
tara:strand:+ start:72200 stop:73207 length:1008 start_codon:yes stop_codon:yes gene_type:complete